MGQDEKGEQVRCETTFSLEPVTVAISAQCFFAIN